MKFKYGDKVKIIKGFYKGIYGRVIYYYGKHFHTDKYQFEGYVKISDLQPIERILADVYEDEIEKTKE